MKSFSFKFRVTNRLLVLAMLVLCAGTVVAQEETYEENMPAAPQSFSLVYIAQDESMPIQEMEKKLNAAWNRATQNPTIFYLSRGREEPIIVKVNTEEVANQDGFGEYIQRIREEFDGKLIAAIKEGIPYSVDGASDKWKLLELLREHPIVTPEGTPLYNETFVDFHVGQDFWTAGFNESVIAALFFELNFKQFVADNFYFNVFCPRALNYDEDAGPFGYLNPDDCRRYINLDRSY